jgi:hypothetical protein
VESGKPGGVAFRIEDVSKLAGVVGSREGAAPGRECSPALLELRPRPIAEADDSPVGVKQRLPADGEQAVELGNASLEPVARRQWVSPE